MSGQEAVVRIRPAVEDDAPGITLVNVRSWQGAYRRILPDSFLDGLEPSSRVERWRGALRPPLEGRFTYVAERLTEEDAPTVEIVGFASGGPERDGFLAGGIAYDGEIYALYLAPQHQRQGIGRRLVATASRRLLEDGSKSVVIWALEDNRPARAFYEALGGVLAGKKHVLIAGAYDLVDVAYVWQDARTLFEKAWAAKSYADGGSR